MRKALHSRRRCISVVCTALALLALWNGTIVVLLVPRRSGARGSGGSTLAAEQQLVAALTAARQELANKTALLAKQQRTRWQRALRGGPGGDDALRQAGVYVIEDQALAPVEARFGGVPPSMLHHAGNTTAQPLVLLLSSRGADVDFGAAAAVVDEWLTRAGAAYRILSEPIEANDARAWILAKRPAEEAAVLLAVQRAQHPSSSHLCNATVSSWMWSSGFVADVTHAADGLAYSLQNGAIAFTIKTHPAMPWNLAAASAAGGASKRACAAGDLSCFFLDLSSCNAGDPDTSAIVDARWVTQAHATFTLPGFRRSEPRRVGALALAPPALREHPTLSASEWLRVVLTEHVVRPRFWLRRAVARVVRSFTERGFGDLPCGVVHYAHSGRGSAASATAAMLNLSHIFSAEALAPLRGLGAVLFLTDSIGAAHDAAQLLGGDDVFGTAQSREKEAVESMSRREKRSSHSLSRGGGGGGGGIDRRVPRRRTVFTVSPATPGIVSPLLPGLVDAMRPASDATASAMFGSSTPQPQPELSPTARKMRSAMVWRLAQLKLAARCDALVAATPSRSADMLYSTMCRGTDPSIGERRAWRCPACTVANTAFLAGSAGTLKVLSACAAPDNKLI